MALPQKCGGAFCVDKKTHKCYTDYAENVCKESAGYDKTNKDIICSSYALCGSCGLFFQGLFDRAEAIFRQMLILFTDGILVSGLRQHKKCRSAPAWSYTFICKEQSAAPAVAVVADTCVYREPRSAGREEDKAASGKKRRMDYSLMSACSLLYTQKLHTCTGTCIKNVCRITAPDSSGALFFQKVMTNCN